MTLNIASITLAQAALEIELFPRGSEEAIIRTTNALECLIEEIKESKKQEYRLTEIALNLFAEDISYIKQVRENHFSGKTETNTQLDLIDLTEEKRLTEKYDQKNLRQTVIEELEPILKDLKNYRIVSPQERKDLSRRILQLEPICSDYERRALVA